MSDQNAIVWPKRFKPIPNGWYVTQLDSGHYIGIGTGDEETPIHWDKYWVRRVTIDWALNGARLV